MKISLTILLSVLLAACAAYDGRGLIVGQSTLENVIGVMGEPRMQWAEADGGRQLAYPRGPFGVHTYMVLIGPDGKLRRIENVLAPEVFARIRAGLSQEQVLRTLGPPEPSGTVYFKARDELVWEWRFCDSWSRASRFAVLFDGTTKLVRSTLTLPEDLTGRCGRDAACGC